MANENVPAPAPTRSDDQIIPFAARVPIGKSNFVLDLQKKAYSFQLDETRFVLDANLLRKALEITPIDQAHQFVSPPSGDTIIDFVNELGYTEKIHFVSRMAVNNLYQPWRAILSMINQCLTGKTSGFDRPRNLVLQMLWGIITSKNVDYAELMWEEFVEAMQTFLTDKANLSTVPQKGKKTKPHVIPYCRFTKLIICHLGRTHNIHQRSASPFHLAEEDHRLGNLNFIPKGEDDERQTLATKEASTRPSTQPQDYASANIVHDSLSYADAETGADKDKTNSGGQAGSDPGKIPESRPPPEQVLMEEDQAGRQTRRKPCWPLAGQTLSPTHDEFMTNVYPNVHESLKFLADEHVILEVPLSSSGTLSSMKNLDDAFTIGDPFLNDKSTKYEPGKLNVEAEVVSMVTVPIYQASSSVPPLSTPVIDLVHTRHRSLTTKTIKHTTSLYNYNNNNYNNPSTSTTSSTTTKHNRFRNLGSRVFTLELRDLPHKINQTVNDVLKEAVYIAFQAPLRDRFRELPEADMK
ncbi:hypothetical protein Tco_0570559 [Tanacetum coccineum]